MSVAFTKQLRPWKNRCTAKSIRFVDVVWSNLGHECPRYMNHKAAIPCRMDIHVRRLHQPASPLEKLLYGEKHPLRRCRLVESRKAISDRHPEAAIVLIQFKGEIQPLATTEILTNELYSGSHERIATVKKISKSSVQMSIYSTEI